MWYIGSEVLSMIVCLSGWKFAGKDECCRYLIEKHNAIRVALADPLKNSVAREFDIDRTSLDDPKRKELPILSMPVAPKDKFTGMIAEFMIKEFRGVHGDKPDTFTWADDGTFLGLWDGGTESAGLADVVFWTPRALAILDGSTKRAVNPNWWTDRAFNKIKEYLENDKLVAVTDLRYKSEIAQFKKEFGDQAVFIRIKRHEESPSNDPSERDLDGYEFDYYLDNTGTLENTYEQVEEILRSL